MPTRFHRYAITESDDIKDALDVARQRWPELADKPGTLLRRLILAGQNALQQNQATVDGAREEAINATKGALAGVYGRDYLDELRSDWPE